MSQGLNQVLDFVPQKYEMADNSGMGLISIQTVKQPKKSVVSGLNADNSRIFTTMTHTDHSPPTQWQHMGNDPWAPPPSLPVSPPTNPLRRHMLTLNHSGSPLHAHPPQQTQRSLNRVKMAACGWGGCKFQLFSCFRWRKHTFSNLTPKEKRQAPTKSFTRDRAHDVHSLRGSPVTRDRRPAKWQVFIRKKRFAICIYLWMRWKRIQRL